MQIVIREIQVKTTVSYHFVPIRYLKSKSQRTGIEDVKKELTHCLWKFKMLQLLWKTVWHFLKRYHDPALPFLGEYQEKHVHTKTCTQMFIAEKIENNPNVYQQM